MKKIDYSPYILKRVGVNSARVGALIRIEWDEGIGYADLHPWPEFGDSYLKGQLTGLSEYLSEYLKTGQETELSKLQEKTIYFARQDALARSQNKSLFEGLEIPKSHCLITREDEVSEESLAEISKAGFKTIKVKVGGEPLMAAISITELAGMATQKLRLDMNALWSASDFKFFADKIPSEYKTRIEFIEDPFHSAQDHWSLLSKTYNFSFARDFEFGDAYAVRIIKPAVQKTIETADSEGAEVKFVVTSYLDHPLGQVAAAFEAAQLKKKFGDRVLECGLLSQDVYEPNEFSKHLKIQNGRFEKLKGYGFGFDEILKTQRWQSVR